MYVVGPLAFALTVPSTIRSALRPHLGRSANHHERPKADSLMGARHFRNAKRKN